jgi:hypothetical protein
MGQADFFGGDGSWIEAGKGKREKGKERDGNACFDSLFLIT